MYSECDGLAGCIDVAGEGQDGTLVLIDWKRSKSPRSKYGRDWDVPSSIWMTVHVTTIACNSMCANTLQLERTTVVAFFLW